MFRWLKRAVLPLVLAAASFAAVAAPASATLEYGPGGGYLHWPVIVYGQQHRYAEAFITGWFNDGGRWMQSGVSVDYPFTNAEAQQAGTPRRTHWSRATANSCDFAYANTCVVEIQDPAHMGCSVYTWQQYDGCTYINYIDGTDHFWYTWIELNWYNMDGQNGVFPLRTRQYRQHVFQHEVGHSFGLAHGDPGVCADVMEPTPTQYPGLPSSPLCSPIPTQFSTYEKGQLKIANHADGFTHGVASTPAGGKPFVVSTTTVKGGVQPSAFAGHPNRVVIRKDAKATRVIKEFSNGVYKITKRGRTYWLGNKNLTRAQREWYVNQGVLGAIVIADTPVQP